VAYRHDVRIRYGECDMQRVVYNANYLVYIDDATDTWMRSALGDFEARGFDFMVKRIAIEWSSPARFGDALTLELEVGRWGGASYDVEVRGHVGERPVFEATLVYISTVPGEAKPAPVPDWVKAALSASAAR
jgi:acyl-CoA thioester hydrolase